MNTIIEIFANAQEDFFTVISATFGETVMNFSKGHFELYVPELSEENSMADRYTFPMEIDGHHLKEGSARYFMGLLFNAHISFPDGQFNNIDQFADRDTLDCLIVFKFIDLYIVPKECTRVSVEKYVDALKRRIFCRLSYYILGVDLCYYGPVTTYDSQFACTLKEVAAWVIERCNLEDKLIVNGRSRMATYMHYVRLPGTFPGEFKKYKDIYTLVQERIKRYKIFLLGYNELCVNKRKSSIGGKSKEKSEEESEEERTELFYFLNRMGVHDTAIEAFRAGYVDIPGCHRQYFLANVMASLLRLDKVRYTDSMDTFDLWSMFTGSEDIEDHYVDFQGSIYRFYAGRYLTDPYEGPLIKNVYPLYAKVSPKLSNDPIGEIQHNFNHIVARDYSWQIESKECLYKKIKDTDYDVDPHQYFESTDEDDFSGSHEDISDCDSEYDSE